MVLSFMSSGTRVFEEVALSSVKSLVPVTCPWRKLARCPASRVVQDFCWRKPVWSERFFEVNMMREVWREMSTSQNFETLEMDVHHEGVF